MPEPVEPIRLETDEEVKVLAGLILDPRRTEPVVCLTSRQREPEPALDPADVREIVGDSVPLYFLRTGPLTRALAERLPPKLEIYGGASRIWWPGVGGLSDPRDHPLLHDRYDVYGSQALEQLRAAWARGPGASKQPTGQDPRLTLLTRERDEGRSMQSRLRGELADAVSERDQALTRAAKAERELREERRSARSIASPVEDRADEKDAETAFQMAIVEEWAGALSPADRREYPIGRYRVGSEFLDSVERLVDPPKGRVAWACSMIACGRAQEIRGLELHALRIGPRG